MSQAETSALRLRNGPLVDRDGRTSWIEVSDSEEESPISPADTVPHRQPLSPPGYPRPRAPTPRLASLSDASEDTHSAESDSIASPTSLNSPNVPLFNSPLLQSSPREQHRHPYLSSHPPNPSANPPNGLPQDSRQEQHPPTSSRWSQSQSYSSSIRSRSGSVGGPKELHPYTHDSVGQAFDERDELTLSEYDTDDDHMLDDSQENSAFDKEEESTSAIRIAEDGTGRIVQANGVALNQVDVEPGTTHLLLGSAHSNGMPSFLTQSIPQIAPTLLVLDISANFLDALPPVLALCLGLEELNVSSNPLRVLPVFLADLVNLRVLIADATGISTLPETLTDLEKLHTISLRRNKLNALPAWLCNLSALQSLYVDGNPFQGPWEALVKPLLAQVPSTPIYPLSTPMFPLHSANTVNTVNTVQSETDVTDTDSFEEPPNSKHQNSLSAQLREDEDHTITPDRAPPLGRSTTSPLPSGTFPPSANMSPQPSPRGLVRTKTAPNRGSRPSSRAKSVFTEQENGDRIVPQATSRTVEGAGYPGDHELRKMKSAGDLRRAKSNLPSSADAGPSRPPLQHYATSLSSSNLLSMGSTSEERPGLTKRFASLSSSSTLVNNGTSSRSNRPTASSIWDNISENEDDEQPSINSPKLVNNSPNLDRASYAGHSSPPGKGRDDTVRAKEKSGRWGFLKKMSMGKMKTDQPPPSKSAYSNSSLSGKSMRRPPNVDLQKPQINTRISTTGNLDAASVVSVGASHTIIESPAAPDSAVTASSTASVTASPGLLSPTSPTSSRPGKRRSFLPVDNLSIPDASPFLPGLTATNDGETSPNPGRQRSPSPVIDPAELARKEEERVREAYSRALRSVMAYLKDMNDLGLSQQASVNTVSSPSEDAVSRARRPTLTEHSLQREASTATTSTNGSQSSDTSSQLRSAESMSAIRSGPSSQTSSMVTTDSSEERKWKDDKGKRIMIIKEIVATEVTYVKGLQELNDIYIKPSAAPVNVLSGVSTSKESIVPAAERKVVFGGLDALFSFHKDSFLPALEGAAAPLMKKASPGVDLDPDGNLSSDVARSVGNMFFKHAAFMRMYSTYINNFDNAVQRVKAWSADRHTPSAPSSTTSPSSSTVQLGSISNSVTSPNADSSSGLALSSSQRKRIRSYLKRCRMNPRHSQLNLEGYLLLPVQRIPRYRLLLEELVRSTPPAYDHVDDPLDKALSEISSLANNMNEGKREAESRRKLVYWQSRIRGKFPSPLVQPHRRLIMDGPLLLTRVVRKTVMGFDAVNAQGDKVATQVECLAPELTPRRLVGILCNDLLVLCRDLSDGQDFNSPVDLWAVLRMQTLPQPASIVHGNALRLVDNKAILYFDAPSPSDALNWFRAINLHIPASKS